MKNNRTQGRRLPKIAAGGLLLLALFLGAGCALTCAAQRLAGNNDTEEDFDQRPENKAPQLERPAWPNYDVNNENSFAVFNSVQSVHESQGTRIFGSRHEERWTLFRCKEATYVAYDWLVPSYQDWWFFRFTTGSAIIDADTGDRYLLREVEYFPMDQCFWIHGQAGQTIRLVLVFAPLPKKVKHVQFYEAGALSRKWMDGSPSRSKTFNVKRLRPKAEPNVFR